MGEPAGFYESVTVRARVPKDDAAQLQLIAEQNDRTLSAEVRRAIRLYITTYEAAS